MRNNDNGYVLLVTLIVISAIFFITSSLYNLSIQRTKWTIQYTVTMKDLTHARNTVDVAYLEIENMVDSFINDQNFDNLQIFNIVESNMALIADKYNLTIRDLSTESCEYPDTTTSDCYPIQSTSYTKAYEIVFDDKALARKTIYVTMLPTFLNYAAGSYTDLTINGGAYIDGDMFVKEDLYISNSANFIEDTSFRTEISTYPTVRNDNKLYLQGNMHACDGSSTRPCYTTANGYFEYITDNFLNITDPVDYQSSFTEQYPIKYDFSKKFIDVNLEESFYYYLNKAAETNYEITSQNLDSTLDKMANNLELYEINSFTDINDSHGKSLIIRRDQVIIPVGLNLNKDYWLIIDGDLKIENTSSDVIDINANILVTGDLSVTGSVGFNSTIYTLGKSLIYSSDIREGENGQLVLMSNGVVEMALITSFNNEFTDKIRRDLSGIINPNFDPDISGFFYSDKTVSIYGLGSYINLSGGVFARDRDNETTRTSPIDITNSYGLLINCYRGSVVLDENMQFNLGSYLKSRVVIHHNNNVFINQPKGLPINNKISILADETIVH